MGAWSHRRLWRSMLGPIVGVWMRWQRARRAREGLDMKAAAQRRRAHAERKRAQARKEAAKYRDGCGWFRAKESRLAAEGRAQWMR